MSSFRIDLGFPQFVSEYKAANKKHPTVKNDIKSVLERLNEDPRVGDQMPRVGESIFKIRLGVKGMFGKRGGYRLIYHVDFSRFVITPIALYFKPDTPNMPDKEVAERFVQVVQQQALAALPAPEKPN